MNSPLLWLLLILVPALQDLPLPAPAPAVGVSATLSDLILPGSELEVRPGDSLTALVVRIVAARPHGELWRYDIEYWGREPGEYDLRDYLRRRDGTPSDEGADALPPVPVRVTSVLPAGRVLPNDPAAGRVPRFGGYSKLMIGQQSYWIAPSARDMGLFPVSPRKPSSRLSTWGCKLVPIG